MEIKDKYEILRDQYNKEISRLYILCSISTILIAPTGEKLLEYFINKNSTITFDLLPGITLICFAISLFSLAALWSQKKECAYLRSQLTDLERSNDFLPNFFKKYSPTLKNGTYIKEDFVVLYMLAVNFLCVMVYSIIIFKHIQQ